MSPNQYAYANGIRFALIAEGKGPLVLLFHGFPDTAHTWDHVRPLIAPKGVPRGQSVHARVPADGGAVEGGGR